MNIKFLVFVAASVLTFRVLATTVYDTLHINRGILQNIEYNSIEILNFNATDTFDLTPHVVMIQTGDDLNLTIINHDTIDHNIQIEGSGLDMALTAPAGQMGSAAISLSNRALLKVRSESDKFRYLGLNTFLVVEEDGKGQQPHFWNLREINVALLKYYDDEYPSAKNDYQAEYFTINNRSYPHVIKDPNVYIKAKVQDTITMYIYNTGLMNHNLHFHGYHAEITYSSDRPNYEGRHKDSMPIDKDQFLVLRVIPEQAGTFPIHNHNLGATVGTNRYNNSLGVTVCGSESTGEGDNLYPFGMLTEIVISPK